MTLPDRVLELLTCNDGLFTDASGRVSASIAVAVGCPDVPGVEVALFALYNCGVLRKPTPVEVRLTTEGRALAGLPRVAHPDCPDLEPDDDVSFFAPGENVILSTAKNVLLWRERIEIAAKEHAESFEGPVSFEATFYMPRPKNIAKIKPIPMMRRPLLNHLERACFDALRGLFFDDDAQVTDARVRKRYASPTQDVGVAIVLREATWDEAVA